MFKKFMIIAVCMAIMMNATGCGLFTETRTVTRNDVTITKMEPVCEVTYDLEALGYIID